MESTETALDFIDLMICPGFLVKNNRIIRVNEAAKRLFLSEDMELLPLIATGRSEYEAFLSGCLWLTLCLAGRPQGATVTRMGDVDVFLADEEAELRELQVLALAAQELRQPLSNVILSADQLGKAQESPKSRDSAARLNRGAAQLQRMICNMSDALRYASSAHLQIRNITSVVDEIFEKAQVLTEHTGISLTYHGPQEDIYTLVDVEQLERAIYNLISNALKFTPKGGTVSGILQKKGAHLQLTIADSGSGIADSILSNLFTRYLRTPSLEDSRMGLGLGMVLVRAAARNHSGTVLIDRPSQGTRISLTIAIQESKDTMLKSSILTVDYAGERDHGLLELSESLPSELYLPRQD